MENKRKNQRKKEAPSGETDVPEIVAQLLEDQDLIASAGDTELGEDHNDMTPTERVTPRADEAATAPTLRVRTRRATAEEVAAQDERWSQALRSIPSPEPLHPQLPPDMSFFDDIEHRTLLSDDLPPLISAEPVAGPTVRPIQDIEFFHNDDPHEAFALTNQNEEKPGTFAPGVEQVAADIVSQNEPIELKAGEPIRETAGERKIRKRMERMKKRRAELIAESQERSTARMDALKEQFAEEDRQKDIAKKVAVAEREMRKEQALNAWKAEQAALMVKHENERRLAAARVDMPQRGLPSRIHLAMMGIVAAGIVAVMYADRDPGGPSRDQAVASAPMELPSETDGFDPDHTQAVQVGSNRIAEPTQSDYESAPTIQVEQQAIPEQAPIVVPEIQQPIVESVIAPAPIEAQVQGEALQPEQVVTDATPEQPLQPVTSAATPVLEQQVPGQAQEIPAMAELIEDMGNQRKVTVGPLTIKKGLFGQWKVKHDDVRGWAPMDEQMAEGLLDTYQVDVARGMGNSTAYAMTGEQFMQMVPEDSRMKRKWSRQQRRNRA